MGLTAADLKFDECMWRGKNLLVKRIHLSWPNVEQLVSSASLNMVKRAVTGKSSKGMNFLFRVTRPPTNIMNRGLRVDHRGPTSRTTLSFSAYGAELFNKLPPQLRDQNLTTNQFKNKLKDHTMTTNLLTHHKWVQKTGVNKKKRKEKRQLAWRIINDIKY